MPFLQVYAVYIRDIDPPQHITVECATAVSMVLIITACSLIVWLIVRWLNNCVDTRTQHYFFWVLFDRFGLESKLIVVEFAPCLVSFI